MNRLIAISVVLLSMPLAGCATLVSGRTQNVTVETINTTGAMCAGTDKEGRKYYWKDTPASSMVHKGDGPMVLTCTKKGFKKTLHTFDETFVGATLGNIILGGGIGILIDAASGAAQEYPAHVRVLMEPEDEASKSKKEEYAKLKKEIEEKAKKEKEEEAKETESEIK